MNRPPLRFDVKTPRTLWRKVHRLAHRSGCSTNLYINTLLKEAVDKQRVLKTGRALKPGARKKANCRFV